MIVRNISGACVTVMFNGFQNEFEGGEEKHYTTDLAIAIASESGSLEAVEEGAQKKSVEVEDLEPVKRESGSVEVVGKDKYTSKKTQKGQVQYRKNGKIISEKAYEAR